MAVLEDFPRLSDQTSAFWQILDEWDSPHAITQMAAFGDKCDTK